MSGILTVQDLERSRGPLLSDACTHEVEVAFPGENLNMALRRSGQVFIPHGDTFLRAGDVLVFVVEGMARQEVIQLCQRPDSGSF